MIRNRRDFLSGAICLVVGIAYAWAASLHEIGHAMDMGAGYFPLLLALGLSVLGGWLVFKSLTIESERDGAVGDWQLRPLAWLMIALVLLGFWAEH